MKTTTRGRTLIRDEFTALPVSRQRKYQLRKRKEGRCETCGRAAPESNRCEAHAIARALSQLEQRGAVTPIRGKWLVKAGVRG